MSAYTVKQVAELSGVSIRALHHYDEIGLLKSAYVGTNGYRYYGRDELLRLQQILFHRELGFPLEEIRRVLSAVDFDRVAALRAHRARLMEEIGQSPKKRPHQSQRSTVAPAGLMGRRGVAVNSG